MIFLRADVYLRSNKNLEEVGEILSRELFGGLPFGGREEYIRDEFPAIYIDPSILGLEIILTGVEADVFVLQTYPSEHPADDSREEGAMAQDVDISEFITFLLRNTQDIKVLSGAELKEFKVQIDA